MLKRLLLTGIAAGLAAGLVVSLAQQVRVTPLILEAETYENPGAAPADGETPRADISRIASTAAANMMVGVGFALLLAAAYTIHGRETSLKTGLLWGLAGYGVIVLAPAFGLPPELPGAPAVEVGTRQLWWAGAVAAAGGGLALVIFSRRLWLNALGGLLIVAPHIVGAPHPPQGTPTALPEALAQEFIIASLATSALFWLFLGGFSGWLYRRLG